MRERKEGEKSRKGPRREGDEKERKGGDKEA